MADWGIKISQEGSDVFTADDDDLILNSEYSQLKLSSKGSGSLSFTTSDSSKSTDIAHGLSYAPLAYVRSEYYDPSSFEKAADGFRQLSFSEYYGAQHYGIYTAVTDSTNLTISIVFDANVPNAATLNYYYIIYINDY